MRVQWRPQPASGPDHELIWFAVSAISIAGAAIWLAFALPWPRCLFLAFTGWPCLTCGSTRALIAFLHGDLPGAFQWNPLAVIAFCTVIVFDLYAAVVLTGRTSRLRIGDWSAAQKKGVRLTAIALLALNWIYLLAHHNRF